jgi:tetratricopeptide (TPR) repeat protein
MFAASRKYPVLGAAALGLLGLLAARPTFAYWDFRPTPLEWASWPEYCQAQYQWVNAGYYREYASRFPESVVDSWRSRIGPDTFIHLHHYCASVIFLNRAKVSTDKAQRVHLLSDAYDNALYTFSRAGSSEPLYATMAGTLAQIQTEQGHAQDAIETLSASIEAQPEQPQPYLLLALAHRKQGRLDLAKQVLEKAVSVVGTQSIELQYNLGLINLELGDVDAAIENAKRVYAEDYPLPGLRNKLKKMGRWPPPSP